MIILRFAGRVFRALARLRADFSRIAGLCHGLARMQPVGTRTLRIGGDEFAAILPDIGRREKAKTVARKIIGAVAAPFRPGGQKQSVGIGSSIGIALYRADGPDTDALVSAADAAMYRARQAGNSFRCCAA